MLLLKVWGEGYDEVWWARKAAPQIRVTPVMDGLFGSDDEGEVQPQVLEQRGQVELYGEIRHMAEVGGNRGVFVSTPVGAGCLICSEKPYITWTPGVEFSDVDSLATTILQIAACPPALECSRVLYPQTAAECKLDECAEVRRLFETYDAADLAKLAVAAGVSDVEVVRIALVLQHNGFNSGLYEKQCMFNHSCEPNCIKLIPPGKHSASEIWTTRPVAANEELVICYYSPVESASQTIRQYLQVNHRFSCTCPKCSRIAHDSGEVDNNSASSVPADVAFEQQLAAIEAHKVELERTVKRTDAVATLRSMYADAATCLQEHETVLSDQYALLARACKVVVAAVLLCINWCEVHNQPIEEDHAVAFVDYSMRVLHYQRQYLGNDYPDVGSTLSDLYEGIQALKQQYPKALSGNFSAQQWEQVMNVVPSAGDTSAQTKKSSAAMATQCAKYCQAEARRIKALYNTAVKYPEAMQLLKAPAGAHFWGGASL
jgi:hypothetical protein